MECLGFCKFTCDQTLAATDSCVSTNADPTDAFLQVNLENVFIMLVGVLSFIIMFLFLNVLQV